MSHRVADGVWWARPCERPKSIPISRPRGAKAKGLSYERGLGSVLPGAIPGQWWEFRDRNGPGWCQTDWFVPNWQGRSLVFECKYTWTPVGYTQIEQLYRPVVERALGQAVIGVVVCKVLLAETPTGLIESDLSRVLARALAGEPVVWHWLGAIGRRPTLPTHRRPSRPSHHSPIALSLLDL